MEQEFDNYYNGERGKYKEWISENKVIVEMQDFINSLQLTFTKSSEFWTLFKNCQKNAFFQGAKISKK